MKKSLAHALSNRIFHLIARFAPGSRSLRPFLHKLRGVKINGEIFIGDEVYIENEYPELVEINDDARLTLRATIIAHMRGPGKVIICKKVYVGPHCFIGTSAGQTLTIGEGSVLAAASVITKSVPPYTFVTGVPGTAKARVTVPLSVGVSTEDFRKGLVPL
jgi:acetyltransferase-like isoleucine patch superfamily enzyme